jgi:hypothetical protein
MKYLLYHAPAAVLRELPCNAGIDMALAGAEELQRRGIPVELVDTSGMGPGELQGRYIEAIGASVVKKYRVRQVFGSRRRAGWLFGRGVPGLVVVGPSGTVEDIYPHERAGEIVTICDFFDSLRQGAAPAGAVTVRSARKRR